MIETMKISDWHLLQFIVNTLALKLSRSKTISALPSFREVMVSLYPYVTLGLFPEATFINRSINFFSVMSFKETNFQFFGNKFFK